MRFLTLTLCLFLSFQASSGKSTIGDSEEANMWLYAGIQLKDVDIVLEALAKGAQLEAEAPGFALNLNDVAHLPQFICPEILALIDQYLVKGSSALEQFRQNRVASDAGSNAELEKEDDFDAGNDAASLAEVGFGAENATASDDSGYQANDADEDEAAQIGLSLTLSLSYSSPRF